MLTDGSRKFILFVEVFARVALNKPCFAHSHVSSENNFEFIVVVVLVIHTITCKNLNNFEVGAGDFKTSKDTDDPTNPYYDVKKRKFTLVPAGGFDGWDVNRRERSYGDMYIQGGRKSGHPGQPLVVPTNDFQAWEMAIDTFSNPENVTINIFATPGITWGDQTTLVQNTIDRRQYCPLPE